MSAPPSYASTLSSKLLKLKASMGGNCVRSSGLGACRFAVGLDEPHIPWSAGEPPPSDAAKGKMRETTDAAPREDGGPAAVRMMPPPKVLPRFVLVGRLGGPGYVRTMTGCEKVLLWAPVDLAYRGGDG